MSFCLFWFVVVLVSIHLFVFVSIFFCFVLMYVVLFVLLLFCFFVLYCLF